MFQKIITLFAKENNKQPPKKNTTNGSNKGSTNENSSKKSPPRKNIPKKTSSENQSIPLDENNIKRPEKRQKPVFGADDNIDTNDGNIYSASPSRRRRETETYSMAEIEKASDFNLFETGEHTDNFVIMDDDNGTEIERNIEENSPTNRDITVVENKNLSYLGSNKKVHATPEEIDEILKFNGEVYTASSGTFKLDNKKRSSCALLANGLFLISSETQLSNPHIIFEIKDMIRTENRKIKKELIVDSSIIRKVHEAYDQRTLSTRQSPRSSSNTEPMQQMQFEFLKIVREAAEMKCSDIHIYVRPHEAYINVRRSGAIEVLREHEKIDWTHALCSAAYNMSDNSEAQYRVYDFQDARISRLTTQNLPSHVQALRLHYNPLGNGGRHLVVRILYETDMDDMEKDVDTLGYTKKHVEVIRKMRKKPFGMNVIAGPTGSGKSTTLQRCLNALMREKKFKITILTIEDPPEYVIQAAAQIPINSGPTDEDKKVAFQTAISAAMRSDPDVIMIGEIRSEASASLSIEAAMTGHQVWASLHANDALTIIERLRDMNVDIYKLTNHTLITGLIGQRLIRKVCPHCSLNIEKAKNKGLVTDEMIKKLDNIAGDKYMKNIRFADPDGCKHCNEQGVSGREVVAECIVPDSAFMKMIREYDYEGATEYWLEEMSGMTILEHAIQKMVSGICDPYDLEDRVGDLSDFNLKRKDIIFSEEFL